MKEVFLDAASNTAMDKKVLKAMKPYLSKKFVGNSRSIHSFGIKAEMAMEDSRIKIADIMGVEVGNVIFTSGATESNNMVIKGLAYKELTSGKPIEEQRRHIICGATEHDSVINACKQLEKIGFRVTYVKPSHMTGRIRGGDILSVLTKDTLLVCIMSINNELGVLNYVNAITTLTAARHIYSLVDCTQYVSYGGEYVELGKQFPHASFMTFSGHKIYGPTGTGCLVATEDNLKALEGAGLIVGGAQEFGLRGGTSNTAGIVGLATAVELIHQQGDTLAKYYEELYKYLRIKLVRRFENAVVINTVPDHKNIVSLNCSGEFYPGDVDSLASMLAAYGIAVSAGSACDSEHDETQGDFNPSHVLVALGLSEFEIRTTIRVSFSKHTTTRDIDFFVEKLSEFILFIQKYRGDNND